MLCALQKTLTDSKGGNENGLAPSLCHIIYDSDQWDKASVDSTSELQRGCVCVCVCVFNGHTRLIVNVF